MLHLPLAHHETSKHDSPNDTKIKVKQTKHLKFEFKPCQVNDSSQPNKRTNHLVSQGELQSSGTIIIIGLSKAGEIIQGLKVVGGIISAID
jgi:hypothetical protein